MIIRVPHRPKDSTYTESAFLENLLHEKEVLFTKKIITAEWDKSLQIHKFEMTDFDAERIINSLIIKANSK